jgi:rhamnopyranosyl-N-acetylglucosaminyl-diphospho-decaprenol beta-1,3/1,4-galactofuranosyltransferase
MSGRPDEQVVAVVVAHGRAQSLDRLFATLRDQTRPPDGVVVVDSDAQPEVREVVERWRSADDRIEVRVLGRNGGSAGSFAAGLEAVLERPEATWIAAFDDDAIPAPDCLERLLDAAADLEGAGALGAVSMDEDREFAWPMFMLGTREPARSFAELEQAADGRPAVPVSELAWHALLLPVETVRRIGPPRAELFMWYEDVEYGLRLRRAGLTAYAVVRAHVQHPPPAKVIKAKVLGVPMDVPIVTPSKAYLMTRNALVVRHEYVGPRFWVVDLPLTVVRALIAIRALPGPTLTLLREALIRPMADAARGRLGPPPVSLMALDAATREP